MFHPEFAQEDAPEVGNIDRMAAHYPSAFSLDLVDQRTHYAPALFHHAPGVLTIFVQVLHSAQGLAVCALPGKPKPGKDSALFVRRVHQLLVLEIGLLGKTYRPVSAQVEQQRWFQFAVPDAQAVEARAEEGNPGMVAIMRMFDRNLGDDAVGKERVADVESL